METKLGELFYYFKNPFLGRAFILVLAIILISTVAMLFFVLPIFYVMVPIVLINVIFAFNVELSAGDIIKASFNLGTKKWLITFGLYIVCSVLAGIVGFLLCGIGSIITAPFVYHPIYFIYKKAVGFEPEVLANNSSVDATI